MAGLFCSLLRLSGGEDHRPIRAGWRGVIAVKSDIEKHCKAKFHRYLESTTQVSQIVWEEHEARDYWLCVHGNRYAVEVTALVERINVGELELS
jgi:hypothetical protein